ncbi:MAG: invasion associated locus B family protein [Alphaproteobacteria bacterium]|nr:invasion associated locus B family protein [Alphaproteobacteria bacterium]
MYIRSRLLIILAATALLTGAAQAQFGKKQTSPAPAPAPAPAAQPEQSDAPPPQGQWTVQCVSQGRTAPIECAMEQSAVLAKTGQLVIQVGVRVPADTRQPAVLLHLPLGLNLPNGTKIQVDEGKAFDVPVQTCENRGCFATAPIAPELLAALKAGKQVKVGFQNMAKEQITIPMQLNDFAAAFEKIK